MKHYRSKWSEIGQGQSSGWGQGHRWRHWIRSRSAQWTRSRSSVQRRWSNCSSSSL